VRRPGRPPAPGTRPTIRFSADVSPPDAPHDAAPDVERWRAGGWSVCNGYGTSYALGPGDQIRFHGWQSTLVGCYGPDSIEPRFFRGLAATRRFALRADTLVLLAADGSRLTFVAVQDSVAQPPR
jgi:heat shock protein HslJ